MAVKRWTALLLAALSGLAAAGPSRSASGQGLSSQPITIVVPYTPGTGIDILARLVADELQPRWGQPVVVENKPGASGNIGTAAVARAAPDGHTVLMQANTLVTNAKLFKALPYDPLESFAPIIEVATGAISLVVHPSVPAQSVREFTEYAKSRPGQINYGSPGLGTPQHLAMELFKLSTKTDIVHVPYRGAAGAVTDLIGGHVSAMFLPVHTALPLVRQGQARMLAVGSLSRVATVPDVPTLAEAGLPGYEVDFWYGLLAPAGTPREIVAKYNGALNEILRSPAAIGNLSKQGLAAKGGDPDALRALIAKDLAKWGRVVEEAGISAQ